MTEVLAAGLCLLGAHAATSEPFPESLHRTILDAEQNQTVTVPAGHFELQRPITLRGKQVTLMGAGADKTVIDAGSLQSGAQALLVKGQNVTVRDLAILNPPADGLKAIGCRSLTLANLRVVWDLPPKKTTTVVDGTQKEGYRGGYGLYPVRCRGVTIRDSVVTGSPASAFYVGQSTDVRVENNRAEHSVIGIEIQNSENVTVRNNRSRDNAIGISIDGRPRLMRKAMRGLRIVDNRLENNNRPNFASPGGPMRKLGQGYGLLMVGTQAAEVRENRFSHHERAHIALSGFPYNGKPRVYRTFNPYLQRIRIHQNHYRGQPSDRAIRIHVSDAQSAEKTSICIADASAGITITGSEHAQQAYRRAHCDA